MPNHERSRLVSNRCDLRGDTQVDEDHAGRTRTLPEWFPAEWGILSNGRKQSSSSLKLRSVSGSVWESATMPETGHETTQLSVALASRQQ